MNEEIIEDEERDLLILKIRESTEICSTFTDDTNLESMSIGDLRLTLSNQINAAILISRSFSYKPFQRLRRVYEP